MSKDPEYAKLCRDFLNSPDFKRKYPDPAKRVSIKRLLIWNDLEVTLPSWLQVALNEFRMMNYDNE